MGEFIWGDHHKFGSYIQDGNGNRNYIDYFDSVEDAEIALRSLNYCFGCINCRYCYCCENCRSCANCQNCQNCRFCKDCKHCRKTLGAENEEYRDRWAAQEFVPAFPNIHQVVASAIGADPFNFRMSHWHSKKTSDGDWIGTTCGTAHCRAGWVTTLVPDREAAWLLEKTVGTEVAAHLIYLKAGYHVRHELEFFSLEGSAWIHIQTCAIAEREGGKPKNFNDAQRFVFELIKKGSQLPVEITDFYSLRDDASQLAATKFRNG